MLSAPGCGVASEGSSGGGTVGPGAIGRVAKFTGVNAVGNSSVNDTGDYATQRIGLGIGNLVGGSHSATKSSAIGYGNEIGQTANANQATALGYQNYVEAANGSNAIGYYNGVHTSALAQAVGGSNYVHNASFGSAFGAKNLVGSPAYSAEKSSAFGYFNQIAQTANADEASAIGYKNRVSNLLGVAVGSLNKNYGYRGSCLGVQNYVGNLGNPSSYSVAVGNHNYVGNLSGGDAGKANAFGYKNSILNSNYAGAIGAKNSIGTTIYTAHKSNAIGYDNQIGQTENNNHSTAVGSRNIVKSRMSTAVGYFNTIDGGGYGKRLAIGTQNKVGSAGFTANYSSAVGYGNYVAQAAVVNMCSAFGIKNVVDNVSYGSVFGAKNKIGSPVYTATNAVVLGYYNLVGQTAIADQSVAVGIRNVALAYGVSVVGYGNNASFLGANTFGNFNVASKDSAQAFGKANSANGTSSAAFGLLNLVGTAAYSATKSSAFGYGNEIGQTAHSDKGTAFGYKNQVKAGSASAVGWTNIAAGMYSASFGFANQAGSLGASAFGLNNAVGANVASNYAMAFGFHNIIENSLNGSGVGVNNLVGSVGYTATKSSAVGYRNTIGQNGNSNFSSVFGYGNTCNNSIFACGIGTNNALGSAAYTASRSCAVGAGNQIGITANAERSCAFGFSNLVLASYANAFGYKAVARISKTTNICGPQIIRKDNGEAANTAFESFCGTEVILFSKEVDLNAVADQTITLPAGCSCWINEVGIIETAQNGTITSQPSIHAGITGSTQKYLANVATTLLDAVKKRERFTSLLADVGEGSVVMGISTGAVLNSATQYKGRFYVKIILLEDE